MIRIILYYSTYMFYPTENVAGAAGNNYSVLVSITLKIVLKFLFQ